MALNLLPDRQQLLLGLTTIATLIAFAANSVLGRAALSPNELGELPIDPVSFTAVRIFSGAFVLVLIALAIKVPEHQSRWQGNWRAALALSGYALAFSLAYLSLSAGTGALILFGLVQATMFSWGIRSGERPGLWQWAGLTAAFIGLVVLVAPGLKPPSPGGALLMAVAGVSWGIYSLLGKTQSQPVLATAGNFLRATPLVLLSLFVALPWVSVTWQGVVLAVISGAVTSGLGYVLWYTALRGMSASQAALVQLSVPMLAALGGVVFLGELVTIRLGVSSALVLGGIGLAIGAKMRTRLPAKIE